VGRGHAAYARCWIGSGVAGGWKRASPDPVRHARRHTDHLGNQSGLQAGRHTSMRLRTIVLAVLVAITGAPALAAAQQRKATQPAQQGPATWPMEQIQGFHVVLVVGETEQGKSSTEKLTEAAARALRDMGEFLPYKSYRVLDAQWSSCCSGPQSRI